MDARDIELAESNRSDSGAASVEYALLAGLIAVVIIIAVTLLGTNVRDLFSTAATAF